MKGNILSENIHDSGKDLKNTIKMNNNGNAVNNISDEGIEKDRNYQRSHPQKQQRIINLKRKVKIPATVKTTSLKKTEVFEPNDN